MTDPPVRVRPATPADRDQIWPLARDLATSYTVDRQAFAHIFDSLLTHRDALVLVAEAQGTIVGYLLGKEAQSNISGSNAQEPK